MNFIIDPTNLNKLSIHSYEGKALLKRYIEYYQLGGSGEGGASKRNITQPETETTDCEEKYCKTPNLVCKTKYTEDETINGIRKCGVLIKSDWPKTINKYFTKEEEEYPDLPISAVFYNNPKIKEINTHLRFAKEVDSRLTPEKKLGKGGYGEVYLYFYENEKNAIKIFGKTTQRSHYEGGYSPLMEYFKKKEGKDRNEVNINDIKLAVDERDIAYYKYYINVDIYSSLFEALLLHKLSQIQVGSEDNNTFRFVSPKIHNVYVFANGKHDLNVAYTMDLGLGSLQDILEKIRNQYLSTLKHGTEETLKGLNESLTALSKQEHHIIDTMQEQIYDLMEAQYNAGYMNLDMKPENLLVILVNEYYNIQIIDSGSKEFTHEVKDILTDLDDELKREIIIFGQQLLVTYYIEHYFKYDKERFWETWKSKVNRKQKKILDKFEHTFKMVDWVNYLYQKYKTKMLPTAIKKLKDLGVTPEQVAKHLISIKKNIEYSYTYMLNLINETDMKPEAFVTKATHDVFEAFEYYRSVLESSQNTNEQPPSASGAKSAVKTEE